MLFAPKTDVRKLAACPLCSRSRWRPSLHVVTWSDATKSGLQHRPNARYPAPLWPRSTRNDHRPYSAKFAGGLRPHRTLPRSGEVLKLRRRGVTGEAEVPARTYLIFG